MARILVCCLIGIFTHGIFAQKSITGRIADAETHEPIPYVNIGIINLGKGTVSDENGFFTLELDENSISMEEHILFSSLGYSTKNLSLSEIESQENPTKTITLIPEAVALDEVIVSNTPPNIKFIDDLVGYPDYGTDSFGYWKEDTALGGELATRIKVKKGLRKLNSLGFEIVQNKSDSILLRINIYDTDGKLGMPKTNLNSSGKNILHTLKKKDQVARIDLKPYSIFVQNDFIVSLELVKVYGNVPVNLVMPAVTNNAASFRRYTSQGEWEKISDSGMGYFLESSFLVSEEDAKKVEKKELRKKEKKSKISGFVMANRRMISGVEVMNMRTKEHVLTDDNGRYSLYAKKKDLITFKSSGYKLKQFIIGKNSTLNVTLE